MRARCIVQRSIQGQFVAGNVLAAHINFAADTYTAHMATNRNIRHIRNTCQRARIPRIISSLRRDRRRRPIAASKRDQLTIVDRAAGLISGAVWNRRLQINGFCKRNLSATQIKGFVISVVEQGLKRLTKRKLFILEGLDIVRKVKVSAQKQYRGSRHAHLADKLCRRVERNISVQSESP